MEPLLGGMQRGGRGGTVFGAYSSQLAPGITKPLNTTATWAGGGPVDVTVLHLTVHSEALGAPCFLVGQADCFPSFPKPCTGRLGFPLPFISRFFVCSVLPVCVIKFLWIERCGRQHKKKNRNYKINKGNPHTLMLFWIRLLQIAKANKGFVGVEEFSHVNFDQWGRKHFLSWRLGWWNKYSYAGNNIFHQGGL